MSAKDAYAAREKKRLADYRAAFKGEAYEKWVASLSADELERARKNGLLHPYIAQSGTADESDGSAEDDKGKPEATVDFYLPLEPGDPGYGESEKKTEALTQKRVQVLRDFLCSYRNPQLAWACLKYLLGFGSCTDQGASLGMTRQAFHYHVRKMQERLGIPPMGNQRSEKVRLQYVANNRRKLKAFLAPFETF